MGLSNCIHSQDVGVRCLGITTSTNMNFDTAMLLPHIYADIDECATNTNTCDQLCNNTIGSFLCGCMDGYRLIVMDNSTCDGN